MERDNITDCPQAEDDTLDHSPIPAEPPVDGPPPGVVENRQYPSVKNSDFLTAPNLSEASESVAKTVLNDFFSLPETPPDDGPVIEERPKPPPFPSECLALLQSDNVDEVRLGFILRYRHDPVAFVKHVLGQTPLDWQEDFLNYLAIGRNRIVCKAGHGVGKSTVCGWALLWHMCTRLPQKSVITAPAEKTLLHGIFADLKAMINKLPEWLRDEIEYNTHEIRFKRAPTENFIAAKTSSKDSPEALAGLHASGPMAGVMIVVDEASGVDEAVFNAAAGSMSTEGAVTILIGNPTRNSGYFWNAFNSSVWTKMSVSCVSCKLVDDDFIQSMKEMHGETSNEFRIRILGEFPLTDDNTLIPASHVDAAFDRQIEVGQGGGDLIYGVDPAYYGPDRSVLLKRRGAIVEDILVWRGLDPVELAGRIATEALVDKPAEICVDTIGIGAGCEAILRHHEAGFHVVAVNVAESASFNPQASRMRDDLWLQVRDWLRSGLAKLPKDSRFAKELREELVSPTYTYTSSGQIKVESKDQMRKRMRKSPDLADALCLSFAGSGSNYSNSGTRWKKGKPLKRNIKGIV